jgi:hypothetical protein
MGVVTVRSGLVGQRYVVTATRLQPGMHVSVALLPGRSGSCCGIGVGPTKVVPTGGRIRVHFTWPAWYYSCVRDGGRDCSRVHWGHNAATRVALVAPEMYRFPRVSQPALARPSLVSSPLADPFTTFAHSAAAGPTDPLAGRGMHYDGCHSSWMTRAGTSGAGIGADVSLAPTQKMRFLGRFYGGEIWAELQGCAPLPYLTGDEYQSIYEQFVCHLEGGVSSYLTGDTDDFEAWRPVVPAEASLVDYRCNPDLGPGGGQAYVDQIIQWAADPSSQKTAWLIDEQPNGTLERRWIPTSQIYSCLKNSGHQGPTALDHDFIYQYLKPRGADVTQAEACGSSPSPTPTPSPVPLPAGEFHVMNATGGIYWRSGADWNTAEATPGNGFYPDTVIKVSCYEVGAANVPGSADGMWEQASWVSGSGGASGWINEHFIDDGVAINQPSPGIPACAAPAPPPPPPQTWSEQETPNHPVNTFTNYHNASGEGPAIAAGQWVQVSCKVYDPTIASVNPDGYWYRIASSPWNNSYYSPANTFMNGDPYGGPYTHNTDFNVPTC